MAKQQNMWIYVIIALIVGVLIGYAVAGGFAQAGKAMKLGDERGGECKGGGNQAVYCSQIKSQSECEGVGVCRWVEPTPTPSPTPSEG